MKLEETQKCVKICSKINSREARKTKKHLVPAWDPEKSNFRSRVPEDACQKEAKSDPLETPKRVKMQILNQEPKNMEVGFHLEGQGHAFEDQNACPCHTCKRTSTLESSSSIFEGCTVRFARFCNRRQLLFKPKTMPREHVFACCAKPLSEATKSTGRTPPKDPQTSSLERLETLRKGFRNRSLKKVTFVAAASPGDLQFPSPGPWKWHPNYI